MILSTESREGSTQIDAEVPLAETFGYATDLRSMTQGQGTFTMEFARYRKVPASLQETIVAEKKEALLVGASPLTLTPNTTIYPEITCTNTEH